MTGIGLEPKKSRDRERGIRNISEPAGDACEFLPIRGNASPERVAEAAREAGITEEFTGSPLPELLAGFAGRGVTLLAARCFDDDPGVGSAAAVLRECPQKIVSGLRLAAKACGAKKILVAAAPGEAKRFRLLGTGVSVRAADYRYPASLRLLGALGRGGEVPALLGAQACAALADAAEGIPQRETVISACGDGFRSPGNYRVRIGAPAGDVLKAAQVDDNTRLVGVGSPVTGTALADREAPVTAQTRCLYALKKLPVKREYPCVRCGRCERACPAGVVPWLVHRELESGRPNALLLFHVGECARCGACSLVCPSGIPLMEEVLLAAKEKEEGGV
jgi:electron transport complex protein RnfC